MLVHVAFHMKERTGALGRKASHTITFPPPNLTVFEHNVGETFLLVVLGHDHELHIQNSGREIHLTTKHSPNLLLPSAEISQPMQAVF